MTNPIRLLTILFPILFLIGCGPSAEEIKKQENQATIEKWTTAVDGFVLKEIAEFYMTSDGKGVVFRESQFESIGLTAFGLAVRRLEIPDYIMERISNTAPVDGNQKDSYDNVEINWSVDRTDPGQFSKIEIYMNLRLAN
jgi:hypothetical protein